jgi:acetyl-CoA C-acetyltransferase
VTPNQRSLSKFADEIVAVEVRGKKGMEPFTADEAPRPDTTIEPTFAR